VLFITLAYSLARSAAYDPTKREAGDSSRWQTQSCHLTEEWKKKATSFWC